MAQEQIRQFIDQATQSIQSGQFEGGLQLLDQALALAPDDADAHLLRGICLSQTGQPVAATDAFNRAISLDPNSAKARYNLSVHQYALGQKLDALKTAREAIDLDPAHAGARQLISSLETELSGPSPQSAPNHNDPLAVPPVTQAPPTIPQAPQTAQPNPYASSERPSEPSMPLAPPPTLPNVPPQGPGATQNPYARSAYEGPEHTIPFVENLGKTWVAVGWILALLSLVGAIGGIAIFIGAMNAGMTGSAEATTEWINNQTGMLWLTRIAGLGSLFGILVWSIMDIIDRRGNFVWLIPNILCSCCGFGWITMPIYILAGRNK